MSKNIFLESMNISLKKIWSHKILIILLILLQLIFFLFYTNVSLNYQTKILENSQAIADYMNTLEFDDASVASDILQGKNLLGDDPLAIGRNYSEITKNFRLYFLYLFLLLVIFGAINWSLASRLIHKVDIKNLLNHMTKTGTILVFYLGLIFLFFYSILSISLTEIVFESTQFLTKYVVFFIIALILIYFMFVSLALVHYTGLKHIVQRTLSLGVKKIHYILSIYVINIFLFLISALLFYYFLEKNLFLMLFSVLMIIFTFVFGRIFLINAIEKLSEI